MPKLKTMEIYIPFSGFYESVYSDAIDHEMESHIIHVCEDSDNEIGELSWPESLRLEGCEYSDLFYHHTDYSAAYRALAARYAGVFSAIIGDELNISAREKVSHYSYAEQKNVSVKKDVKSLRLTFADMESPREYNFATDRIVANIPISVIHKLWAIVRADKFEKLSKVANARHSSRDGFKSFYANDWQDWGLVRHWDCNQLETLLIAACEVMGADYEDSDLHIFSAMVENEGAYSAWQNAVNWQAIDSAKDELRATKLVSWIEGNPDSARSWIANNAERGAPLVKVVQDDNPAFDIGPIEYRCNATLNLFAGVQGDA